MNIQNGVNSLARRSLLLCSWRASVFLRFKGSLVNKPRAHISHTRRYYHHHLQSLMSLDTLPDRWRITCVCKRLWHAAHLAPEGPGEAATGARVFLLTVLLRSILNLLPQSAVLSRLHADMHKKLIRRFSLRSTPGQITTCKVHLLGISNICWN